MKSRLSIDIKGAVQGIGFRPFIHRIANELHLTGYVLNSPDGVKIEIEGGQSTLEIFLTRFHRDRPSLAVITGFEFSYLDPVGFSDFEIRSSENNGNAQTFVMPDLSLCNDCLKELFNPSNRRYLYPFINCTNCGPRFSIIEKLPYDRPNTSMKIFEMCDDCRSEYENISTRRYHAQPIACHKCGPHVELWDSEGNVIAIHQDAIELTIKNICKGNIIALKGLGGFQLIVDSLNDNAVNKLRERKHRDEKPFALMFPDLDSIKNYCCITKHEERILVSPESPIVLVKKNNAQNMNRLSEHVAPVNPYLGVMLPYTPLHHIIMRQLQIPVVATSGNLAEEPMCIDNFEALNRLKGTADFFLVHNRPILRHVDDSIVKIVCDRSMILRRARGYAPLPVSIKNLSGIMKNNSIIAVGGHLKNTIALKNNENIFISQHIGDLSNRESFDAFKNVINDFRNFYSEEPETIIVDLHPEYLSTKFGKSLAKEFKKVQHHYAHVASCRFENEVTGDALGVSWDGTGLGYDNTIWGGEFFISRDNSHEHIGQFKQFMLPGGETAVKESKRSAAGVLYSLFGKNTFNHLPPTLKNIFSKVDLETQIRMMERNINSSVTSSVGRLFDAVSSLLGICQKSNYEGQAAMMLEFAAAQNVEDFYPFEIRKEKILIVDWHPMLMELLNDIKNNVTTSTIAAKYHNTLAEIILRTAIKTNLEKVILSGGCFQNLFLIERTINLLEKNNFKVYRHQRIPTNDGGISLGQAAAYIIECGNCESKKNTQLIKEKT